MDENIVIKSLYKIALKYLGSLQKSMVDSVRNSRFHCFDEFKIFKRNAKGKVSFVFRAADGWLIGCEIIVITSYSIHYTKLYESPGNLHQNDQPILSYRKRTARTHRIRT